MNTWETCGDAATPVTPTPVTPVAGACVAPMPTTPCGAGLHYDCRNNAWQCVADYQVGPCPGPNCPTPNQVNMTCKDNRGNPAMACGDGTCSCYNQQMPMPQPYQMPDQRMMNQQQPYQQPQDEQSKCTQSGGMWCGTYCRWGDGRCEEVKTYQMPTPEMDQSAMAGREGQRYLKDAQRGVKDMERGLKQFEKMKGITPETQVKVTEMREMINKIKNAKSAEELQYLDMGQIGNTMMEMDNSRREMENNKRRLDDAKRNIKNAEQGVKMFERQIKKVKNCAPADITDKLATLKQSIAIIKGAKTWEEVEAANLEDIGSLFMDLDESRQVLEVCGRWPQMSKDMDRTLKDLNRQLKLAKSATARLARKNIDVSSLYSPFEEAVRKMQSVRDEAAASVANGDIEEAMRLLEEDFFGQMEDVTQYPRLIQMMSGVGQFNAEFKRGLTQANSRIKKLQRQKIDVTELKEMVAEIKSQGNEIATMMEKGNFDPDEVIAMIDDMESRRRDFENRMAELMGTAKTIMPWEQGNQMFKKVEMPTFLNQFMRPPEIQATTVGPGMVSESNPQPSPGPATMGGPSMVGPSRGEMVGEFNPSPAP